MMGIVGRCLISAFLSFLWIAVGRAQGVELQDVAGERGSVVLQPLVGSIPTAAQSLVLQIRYPYYLLAWRGFQPQDGYLGRCSQPRIIEESIDSDAGIAIIRLRCDSLIPAQSGIALLRWEILAGPDSLAVVQVEQVEIDGQEIPVTKDQGIVRILSVPVKPRLADVLEILSENPVRYRLTVRYRLSAASVVTFRVFAINGDVVLQRTVGHKTAGIDWKEKFEFSENIANGVYFLVMKTERGSYVLPFTLVR